MNYEYTLSILKPDATTRNITGKVNSYIENADLKIAAQKMLLLTKDQAEKFYEEHSTRSFFNDLVSYMTSAPVIVQVLKGQNAVAKNREIMGSTNPADANAGTIRKDFGISIEENTIHGSDSAESAKREIDFFFSNNEIYN